MLTSLAGMIARNKFASNWKSTMPREQKTVEELETIGLQRVEARPGGVIEMAEGSFEKPFPLGIAVEIR